MTIYKLGGILTFYGLASIIMALVARDFGMFSWENYWGSQPGWMIRISMVLVGLALNNWLSLRKGDLESVP